MEDDNVSGGHGIVKKRGICTNSYINRNRSEGHKPVVPFNSKGQPIGDIGTKLNTAIGICARTTVPIIFDDWRQVPPDLKEKIWQYIEV